MRLFKKKGNPHRVPFERLNRPRLNLAYRSLLILNPHLRRDLDLKPRVVVLKTLQSLPSPWVADQSTLNAVRHPPNDNWSSLSSPEILYATKNSSIEFVRLIKKNVDNIYFSVDNFLKIFIGLNNGKFF